MDREVIKFVQDNEEGLIVIAAIECAYWIVRQLVGRRMEAREVIARIRHHHRVERTISCSPWQSDTKDSRTEPLRKKSER